MGWWSGSKNKYKQLSTLTPEQQDLQSQLEAASSGRGAGGAAGSAADYWRDLLSNDSRTNQMLAAPEMRRFNEEIIPSLSEQFAGMGAGALSSSGFRNAAVNAGADLSERLGAIRAGLRQQGAQGLQGISQQALSPVTENIMEQGQPGFGQGIAQGVGQAIPSAIVGGLTGGLPGFGGGLDGSLFSNLSNMRRIQPAAPGAPMKGSTGPYGNKNLQLPNVMQQMR